MLDDSVPLGLGMVDDSIPSGLGMLNDLIPLGLGMLDGSIPSGLPNYLSPGGRRGATLRAQSQGELWMNC